MLFLYPFLSVFGNVIKADRWCFKEKFPGRAGHVGDSSQTLAGDSVVDILSMDFGGGEALRKIQIRKTGEAESSLEAVERTLKLAQAESAINGKRTSLLQHGFGSSIAAGGIGAGSQRSCQQKHAFVLTSYDGCVGGSEKSVAAGNEASVETAGTSRPQNIGNGIGGEIIRSPVRIHRKSDNHHGLRNTPRHDLADIGAWKFRRRHRSRRHIAAGNIAEPVLRQTADIAGGDIACHSQHGVVRGIVVVKPTAHILRPDRSYMIWRQAYDRP